MGNPEDRDNFAMEADAELEPIVLELRELNVGREEVRRIVVDVVTRDPEHQTSTKIARNIGDVFFNYTLKFGQDIGGQPEPSTL